MKTNHKVGDKINVEINSHVEVTIKRNNGLIEIVRMPAPWTKFTPHNFAQVKAATKAAGKGECLSYKNVMMPASYTFNSADAVDQSHDEIQRAMHLGE